MPSEARQNKIMEKLNRAQKCSILGPQNLGLGGARAPGAPPGSAPVSILNTPIYSEEDGEQSAQLVKDFAQLGPWPVMFPYINNTVFWE